MTRVLVVTADVLRQKMAGPAIRSWEIAKQLSRSHDVRLVSTSEATVERDGIGFRTESAADDESLRKHVEWCEVLVFQGFLLSTYPWIAETDVKIVADLYDPMHLEQLEQSKGKSIELRDQIVNLTTAALDIQIRRADFMMCASEKQRFFWLGQLAANGRINPYIYEGDGQFRNLLSVVPFGVDQNPPLQSSHGIKGTVPGISLNDELLIWGGGIYNWFDPITLVRAMDRVRAERPRAKLFFMGSGHPNPDVPTMAVAAKAYSLAEELGLLNRVVFFNEGWVSYDDRANYLLDADLGVSTHHLHLETEFSFRTRILDYLWTDLPMVVTEGDGFAEIVEARHLGKVVPAENEEALARAIIELLSDAEKLRLIKVNVAEVAEEFFWPRVLKPLIDFCDAPTYAPDRQVSRSLRADEAEIMQLKLKLSVIEHGILWRIFSPLRRVYSRARNLLKLNPSVQAIDDYMRVIPGGDLSRAGLKDFLKTVENTNID